MRENRREEGKVSHYQFQLKARRERRGLRVNRWGGVREDQHTFELKERGVSVVA